MNIAEALPAVNRFCYHAGMIDNPFNRWLDDLRVSAGLEGPTALARYLGVPQPTLSKWLGGQRPSPRSLRRVAKKTSTPEEQLFWLAGHIGGQAQAVSAQRVSEPIAYYMAGAQPRSGGQLEGFETRAAQWFFVHVEGDCLVPDIQPGAVLLFDRQGQPEPGRIVCVIVNGESHVKKVVQRNGVWVLESRQGRLEVPVEDITVVGVMIDDPWYQRR